MTRKMAFTWILKVYKLKEPYWVEPIPGDIRYANLKIKFHMTALSLF